MPIKDSFGKAEKIGVIGSPSSTGGLTIDVLGSAVEKRLVGNLSVFHFKQDDRDHYALGQITEITMKNTWTEDPTMRGIIRHKGRVDPVTEKQDVHMANMTVSSVFCENNGIEPSILGTVPATGTPIRLLNTEILDSLLENFQNELFYLGQAYGTTIKMPMWLKHFGKEAGGIGEAYHIGIFGKTGSGKSILASMMMAGYAKHKKMSIFILDPQGQFSREVKKPEIKNVIERKLEKPIDMISLFNLVISGYEVFKKVLISSNLLKKFCNIKHPDNQSQAADQIVNILNGRIRGQAQLGQTSTPIEPWNANKRASFDRVWNALLTNTQVQQAIYTTQSVRDGMISAIQSADPNEVYEEWKKIANLFTYDNKTNAKIIKKLVNEIIENPEQTAKVLVIDLSETSVPDNIFWNDQMKNIIIGEFLSQLIKQAEDQYKKDKLLNTLVILDEAHRLAPKESTENEALEEVKSTLIDAIRTTRKFGLGWMFISQTLSSLDKEIINQIRIFVFGFGLAWGLELQSLREIIGGNKEAIRLYQMFKDPQSSIGEKEYSFMSIGPISPLSFSGTPLFFSALRYPDEFLKANFEGTK